MELKHPITDEEFETLEATGEAVVQTYYALLKQKYQLEEDLKACVKFFNEFVGDPEKKTGQVKADTTHSTVKVTRRENVRYSKKDGKDVFAVLVERYPWTQKLFSVSVREKAGEVKRLLDNEDVLTTPEGKEVAEMIKEYRNTSPGSPAIEIVPRKQDA